MGCTARLAPALRKRSRSLPREWCPTKPYRRLQPTPPPQQPPAQLRTPSRVTGCRETKSLRFSSTVLSFPVTYCIPQMPRSKFTQHVRLFCSCAWVKWEVFGLFYYKFIYFKKKTILFPSLICWILQCKAFRILWRINNFNSWPENDLWYIMIKLMY